MPTATVIVLKNVHHLQTSVVGVEVVILYLYFEFYFPLHVNLPC